MPHSPAIARRAVVALSAAALTGSGLVAAAGSASAAPADPDITGVVTNAAGAPLAGIRVTAYTTPSDGSVPLDADVATTDATGKYVLDGLDPASLTGAPAAIASETEFKLYFDWRPTVAADYHTAGYLDRGLGGSKSVNGAASVVVPAGAAATAPTQALPTAGGVLLAVKGSTGAPVNAGGGGSLYRIGVTEPGDFAVASTGGSTGYDDPFYPDADANGTPDAPVDGLVYIAGVEPGEYALQAYGQDVDAVAGVYKSYVSRFFGGDGTYAKAKPVKVTAGALTPVTVQLSNTLTATEKPRILGNSSIGSKLKADPGSWLSQADTDYTYQWLRGSTPVATGDTYKVTKKDKGKKIKLVVTAADDFNIGTAVAAPTSKVGLKSKVTVAKRNADGSLQVKVVPVKKGTGVATGKVVLLTEDGATASKKVKLKNGVATLTPRAKYAGEKLVVAYLGGGGLGSDTVAAGGSKKGKGGKGDQ